LTGIQTKYRRAHKSPESINFPENGAKGRIKRAREYGADLIGRRPASEIIFGQCPVLSAYLKGDAM
jgi:hypothetical protein